MSRRRTTTCIASTAGLFLVLVLACPISAQQEPPGGVGLPQDWSSHRVLFTNGASPEVAAAAARDPRSWINWVRRTFPRRGSLRPSADNGQTETSMADPVKLHTAPYFQTRTDWAVSLGPTGGMPLAETPAKFSFNTNGAPDCANDFVVFVIAATPGVGTQANIVAFNNLYSGPPPNLCGVSPTFLFSYAVGNGAVVLSPVLSLNGKKVAFVEASNPSATFNVLTWVAGQGTNATAGAVAPGGGSSVTTLDYTNITVAGCAANRTTNGTSSPFIDYVNDVAYVGADNGVLYRIKNVFNGTPALDYCITVNAGNLLTSPVFDFVSGKVFVSDRRRVYAYTPGVGSFTLAASILIAGTAGSIELSPIVDSTNGFVYAFSSHNLANSNSIVSQMPVSLASHVDAAIGPVFTGQFILDGDFDDKYYTNGPATGSLYACGVQTGATAKPSLFTLSFQASGIMNTVPAMSNDIHINTPANPNSNCSPLTEFFDGTTDRLFAGVGRSGATNGGNLVTMWNITNRITLNTTLPAASAGSQLGGTSGFAIDNDSPLPQASSIYFGTLATGNGAPCGNTTFCAVKLTQAALQ
jgi:hypothetical protein